jgi:hypothetical protein
MGFIQNSIRFLAGSKRAAVIGTVR